MEFKDYYQVMGVARDASDAQIKQAYRKLARKYHPDVSKEKDAESRFKELGEAYEVLKSAEKRAAYDRLGQGPRPGENFKPPPDWNSGFEFSGAGPHAAAGGADYSDFFESLFGGAATGGRRGARHDQGSFDATRGDDHHARVMLDLDATLQGGSRQLTLRLPQIDAEGRLVSTERTLNVHIPKGILPGQTIRLAGQGAAAPLGGTPGDLYIEVEFQPHALYRVEGRDLYLELPVAPWEAALGGTVPTPTPGGLVELKIPAGSHAGTTLRLKARGIPAAASGVATSPAATAGDFYVVLQIALPPATDEKAKAAYRAMAAALPFNPRTAIGV